MSELKSATCEPCRAGAPTLSDEEIAELQPQVPDWTVIEIDGVNRLQRRFRFGNFAQALEFTDKTSALAEENNHHPQIVTEWGAVTVTWWTHKINGLHRNDFVMAAKTDQLLGSQD